MGDKPLMTKDARTKDEGSVQLARPHNFPQRGGPGKSKLPIIPFFKHFVMEAGLLLVLR